jgi:8-hydroxy-5-deazaflavin:NADPH oxidoreductase
MNIGILGSGMVGKELGLGLIRLGHSVKIGTRDKSKLDEWLQSAGGNASVGSFREAAEFGEIIFLCTFWGGTQNAIELAGKENFRSKTVIDVTNPLDFSGGMPPKFAAQPGRSGGEIIQETLKDAKVVKAFNIINAYTMIKPDLEDGKADLFICGNDNSAKAEVIKIAEAWGWENVIDMGDISESYWLESLTMLWVHYGVKFQSWGHAFKLLKK